MTQISPLHRHDMTAHFTRMRRDARREKLAHVARDLGLRLALITAAALSGYLLGAAKATCDAMPGIIAESEARAAW